MDTYKRYSAALKNKSEDQAIIRINQNSETVYIIVDHVKDGNYNGSVEYIAPNGYETGCITISRLSQRNWNQAKIETA